MGLQKGINDDAGGRINSKKKKKREEEKRIRDMVEFQLEQERKKYLQKIKETEDNVQYLMQQLAEEQMKNTELSEELQIYRAKGEVPVNPHLNDWSGKQTRIFQVPRDLSQGHYVCRCRGLPRRRLLVGQHLLVNNGNNDSIE